MKKLIFVLLLFLIVIKVEASSEPVDLFKQANNEYANKNYSKSIELYEKIIKQGFINSNVYYNLGNAYYRNQELGKAILYYKKAQKLAPEDESIQLNLKIANLKTVDKIKKVPQFFLYAFFENTYKNILPGKAAIISLILWFLGFALIATFIISKNSLIKKVTFFATIVAFIISIFFFYISVESINYHNNETEGVIITPSVYVKSSPDANALDAFILHEGTSFTIIDKLNNWFKIKLESGNIGWVQSSVMEKY